MSPRDTLRQLQTWFGQWDSALVAYSGGVDSALIMVAAYRELTDRALACIGVSPSYPAREMRQAVKLAEQLDIPYRLINTQEHLDENYAANPNNRCYFCKSELYGQLRGIADQEQWHVIVDGTNASDLGDDRPGRAAGRELGVRSPLIELAVGKTEVRRLAQHLDLPVWNKPAMACLSSRVPHGTPITAQLLKQIEQAEDVLVELGFNQFRVRHHQTVARIELPALDLQTALQQRDAIVKGIRNTGYQHVCLDLGGFRATDQTDAVNLTVEGKK